MLSINTNLSSLIAQNSMKSSSFKLDTAIERMTTGYKINHAKDNAANYSIATNMQTQIGSYNIAADNVAMGMDLVTTASDTVSLMQDKAQRLRALCTQARNGTFGAQSLAAINTEANAIVAEIDRIYSTAQYNGVSLFTGGTSEASPAAATFAMTRAATPSATFIVDPQQKNVDHLNSVSSIDPAAGFTESEYKIAEVADLVALAELTNNSSLDTTGVTFILANDLDIGAHCDAEIANGNGGWTPIGDYDTDSSYLFKGIFDGNGHVIKNLKIYRDAEHQGLFGYAVSGSEIKNIGLEGGSVKGSKSVGSLAGMVVGASISNSYATGVVSGTSAVGGLVGRVAESSIRNSYSTGDVTATGIIVGGLVGCYDLINTISNSCATGAVSGTDQVGGLVGGVFTSSSSHLLISNSYATGAVSGTKGVGGLVGSCGSISISNSYATGAVTGTSNIGGLVGSNPTTTSSSSISNSYATGAVSGTDKVGGLVGRGFISISNSYATGAVTGTSNVGGLVGENTGSITNSAAVQTDLYATLMTEEQIKSTYTLESMGFTEASGWTASGEHPILTWQTTMYTPSPTPGAGGGSSSGGSYGVSAFNLQIGTYSDSSCQIGFDINFTYDLSAIELDISSDEALDTIDNFIIQLSEHETKLGAVQNRLESALESISVNIENLTSSLSTIRDADIAEVSSQYIQQQILQQAAATLMSTANQSPAIALQLI